MTRLHVLVRSVSLLAATVGCLALPTAVRAANQAAPACVTRDACLDAIMDAAMAGNDADVYALMNALRRRLAGPPATAPLAPAPSVILRTTMVPPAARAPVPSPLPLQLPSGVPAAPAASTSPTAQAPIQSDGSSLGDVAARSPNDPDNWLALADQYARQDRHDRAVASLVVAHAWSADPAAMRRAWGQAAEDAPLAGMRADYATALARVAVLDAARRRDDAAVPRPPAGNPAWRAAALDFRSCVQPRYPKSALKKEETGKVDLEFVVDADGVVRRVLKRASSGSLALDNEAMLSLASCRFKPATVDGKPVASRQPVQYVWTLE